MLNSPVSHFFRHALLSYKESSVKLKQQALRQKLGYLESALERMQSEQPSHPKVLAMLERIRKIRENLP
ncbi:hypothetical protein HYU18_04280 [Candidatus Woesearchaeota archaeon]|nr:hypothetical protein [Candidatus Woesearchaeota archaeon]